MQSSEARARLLQLFYAAVAAVHPSKCVPGHLPRPPRGRTLVLGAGKASAAMAAVVEAHWPQPLSGLVITRYGHGMPTKAIEVVEAGHPVPDEAGAAAAARMMAMLHGLTADDLVLFLGSGGGSALMVVPADDISLSEKQTITRALLKSGAPIEDINIVRKHLSAAKGGGLAHAAQPAQILGLYISDVVGDDPATIASGPTAPDPSTREDARAILRRYGIAPSAEVNAWLADPRSETPKPADPIFARTRNLVIASAKTALAAAEEEARNSGLQPVLLGEAMGEARDLAAAHAGEVRRQLGQSGTHPRVLLSGGETTVTVRGNGRGGRNTEYLLALGLALAGNARVWGIACDTDGIDGTGENAGAILTPDSLARAQTCGIDAAAALARNDSYAVFSALGDLVTTGPTRTNVSDFRAILILPQ